MNPNQWHHEKLKPSINWLGILRQIHELPLIDSTTIIIFHSDVAKVCAIS